MPALQQSKLNSSPVVTLPQGKLVGIVQSVGFLQPVECFLGFSYAQPPVGNHRFRPPAPLEPSTETFHAQKYGKAAPRKSLIPPRLPLEYSEDCLTANIFRAIPKNDESDLLPVLVCVHGGVLNRGNLSMQNTASLVACAGGSFVAVSFKYRIDVLRFLPTTKSAEEGILDLGIRDQVLHRRSGILTSLA
jgi:carboxylesterase type B